jgi:plastocyanin
MRWLLAIVATLALAPSAYAQGATIQGFDEPPGSGYWAPKEQEVKARVKVGETVTWTWSGTHNVVDDITGAPWDIEDYESPATHAFPSPGTYGFKCSFHPAMIGRVEVTDASGSPPPPPPPPPPSEQPWTNDQQPPTVFELADEVRPRLTRVRVAAVRDGARVRFRLSERARVTVRFRLGGVPVKTARKTFGAGRGRLTVRDRRMDGRYRLEIIARDLSGNRSRVKHASVTVR